MSYFQLLVHRARTSVHYFDKSATLTTSEIETLVEAATQAPSSFNLQHWRFVAVTTPEAKERLLQAAYQQDQVRDASVTFIVLGDLRAHEDAKAILTRSVEAGIIPPSTAEEWTEWAFRRYGENAEEARNETVRSSAMAAMSIMMIATSMGLGSSPMIGFDPVAVKEAFGIEDRYMPVMLVAVGRRADGNTPRKVRLSVKEVLTYNEGPRPLFETTRGTVTAVDTTAQPLIEM